MNFFSKCADGLLNILTIPFAIGCVLLALIAQVGLPLFLGFYCFLHLDSLWKLLGAMPFLIGVMFLFFHLGEITETIKNELRYYEERHAK
jgi:multisubunit Na+/H+ antiporter MnhG subunit